MPLVWRWRRRWMAALLLASLFFGCLALGSRNNRFPIDYHPDELGKVEQIVSGNRNYHHPQLLLEATHWAVRFLHTPNNPQSIVRTGRWVSAMFIATAVVALAWCGYLSGGLAGLVVVGSIMGLCPQLLAYAHYMKEDAALICGVALTALGIRFMYPAQWSRTSAPNGPRGVLSGAFLGFACAVAISGKYVGAMVLLAAVPAVLIAPSGRRCWIPIRSLVFCAVLAGTVALVNHRVLGDWERFNESFQYERRHGVTDHEGLTMVQPNHFIADAAWFFCPWHIRVLMGLALALLTAAWRKHTGWDYLVLWLGIACLGILSFGVIPFQRYALPVVMLGWFLSALGLIWLLDLLRNRPGVRAVSAAGMVCGIVLLQWPVCADTLDQFRNDSRERVRHWIAGNLPAGSKIAADGYAVLLGRRELAAMTVESPGFFAADLGDLQKLRQNKFTHAVICDLSYLRFFTPQTSGAPGKKRQYAQRRQWYQQIMHEGKLVWEYAPKYPLLAFTNPTVKVYELP